MQTSHGRSTTIAGEGRTNTHAGLKTEDVRTRIADQGGEALIGTPEQQAADIDAEETKWGALVRKLGLRPE